MIKVDDIKYNAQSEFHMLRHYKSLQPELVDLLLKNGYTCKQINDEFAISGSKFFPDFADNIKKIIDQLLRYGYEAETGVNKNISLTCEVPPSDFPNGIGTNSVVSIDEIPANKRQLIYTKINRGIELYHFDIDEYPLSNKFIIILKPLNDGYLFISAFPGEPSMPIPSETMEENVFKLCEEYWRNHVFLVQNI